MPPYDDRTSDNKKLAAELGMVISYQAGDYSVDDLMAKMSFNDWNDPKGENGSLLRQAVARGLTKLGRKSESGLLRGPNPIYVSGGRIRQRLLDPKKEADFVKAYLALALRYGKTPAGKPLNWVFDPDDYDDSTRDQLVRRAVAFVNDMRTHFRDYDLMPPEPVAEAYWRSHNRIGDSFENDPEMEALDSPIRKLLTQRAAADGPVGLSVRSGKVTRNTG